MASKNRTAQQKAKRNRKARDYRPERDASERSKYGRKARFLARHGGRGDDYPDKPWRGSK